MTGFAASSHQMQVKSALIFSKILIVPAGCLATRPRLAQYEPETHGQAAIWAPPLIVATRMRLLPAPNGLPALG
jgi:hypothetical protein